MSPASPGPVQTEASCCVQVTKALLLIFLLDFLLFLFFPSEFPSCFRQLSSPSVSWALSHCASVFPLHALPAPSVYFYKQTVVFIQFPLVFFEFFSSSNLLCSSPILSTCLPIQNAAEGACFQLGLFCLVYWSFLLPYVLQEPPFFIYLLFHLLIRSQDTATSSLL